jgi:hypothetical protein
MGLANHLNVEIANEVKYISQVHPYKAYMSQVHPYKAFRNLGKYSVLDKMNNRINK